MTDAATSRPHTRPLRYTCLALLVLLATLLMTALASPGGLAAPTSSPLRNAATDQPHPAPPNWYEGIDNSIIRHLTDEEVGQLPKHTRPGGKTNQPLIGRQVDFGKNYLGRLIDDVRIRNDDFGLRNYVAVVFQRKPDGPYEVLVHGKDIGDPHSERGAIEWLLQKGYTILHLHSELAPCVLSNTLCAHWLAKHLGPGGAQSGTPTVTYNLPYPADKKGRRKSIAKLREHLSEVQQKAERMRRQAAQVAEFFSKSKAAANISKTNGAPGNNPELGSSSCPGSAAAPGSCGHTRAASGLLDAINTGGIDFRSLELRYLSETDTRNGGKIEYAFKAPKTANGTTNAAVGIARAKQASDAFFTWLALPEEKFWVNLNPNEPDRIIDPKFGRTDAGRILLEADMELKRTVAKLIHPDTKTGQAFWRNLRSDCFSSRQWIVPAPATVRATNDELYILDAPLSVLMETEYVQDRGSGKYRSCRHLPESVEKHNEELYKRLILPRVEKAVNTAPEYAALRRVYLARVAAEWYRDRAQEVPSAFADLIDSDDIRRWKSTSSWKPTDTFREYVRSFTKGEFKVTRKVGDGAYKTYVYGGVDFGHVFYRSVSDAEFERTWPGLTDAVKTGLHEATTDPKTDDTWLGGTSIGDPEAARAGKGEEAKGDAGKTGEGKGQEPQATRSTPGGGGPRYVVPALVGIGVVLMLVGLVYTVRSQRRPQQMS